MSINLSNKKYYSSGQALLIVLIGMGAALVLVLSVVSRSITDISLSTKEDEAARAFSAAEAGVEKILMGSSNLNNFGVGNNSFVSGEKLGLAEGVSYYNLPDEIVSGGYGTIWFVPHDDNGYLIDPYNDPVALKICWGSGVGGIEPALEVSVYYDEQTTNTTFSQNYSAVKVFRAAFDPNVSRRNSNSFAAVDSGDDIDGKAYPFCKSIDVEVEGLSGVLFVRTKLLYNDIPQPVGITTNVLLPSQGMSITSTGTYGDATRRVEVQQTYRDVMPFIDDGLYSTNTLTKS